MRSTSLLFLSLGVNVLAAKWAIDGSCDLVPIKDPGNGLSPFIQATDIVKTHIQDALMMAENALNVMNNHANDQHVSDMLKLVLGESADFQSKVDKVKQIFGYVKSYDKEPSADRPFDKGWQDTMTNNDVMIFCSNGRFKQFDPITATSPWWDTASKNKVFPASTFATDTVKSKCHTVAYDLDKTAGWSKAYVVESNYVDLKGYRAAKPPKNLADWKISQPNVAFTMDFCNWYLHESLLNGWLRIDKTLVMKTQQPDFKRGTLLNATPIDGLRMAGVNALHELTHTNPSNTVDVSDASKNPICYGWKCIQDIKNPNNADSVAMLALALHIWTLGFYIDKDGNVMNK